MRRLLPVLLIFAFVLTGCIPENEQLDKAMLLRESLQKSKGCSFRAVITADYGETLHTFTLACTADALGSLNFQVKEPDSIFGIAGSITKDGGTITFDGKALAFPLLADDQLSPVCAPWVFLHTLLGGYISGCGKDGEYSRITLDDTYCGETLQSDIWLDASDCPVRCEILYKGKRILSLDVRDFTLV